MLLYYAIYNSKTHFLKLGLVESLQDFTHQIQSIGIQMYKQEPNSDVVVVKHLGG